MTICILFKASVLNPMKYVRQLDWPNQPFRFDPEKFWKFLLLRWPPPLSTNQHPGVSPPPLNLTLRERENSARFHSSLIEEHGISISEVADQP